MTKINLKQLSVITIKKKRELEWKEEKEELIIRLSLLSKAEIGSSTILDFNN